MYSRGFLSIERNLRGIKPLLFLLMSSFQRIGFFSENIEFVLRKLAVLIFLDKSSSVPCLLGDLSNLFFFHIAFICMSVTHTVEGTKIVVTIFLRQV